MISQLPSWIIPKFLSLSTHTALDAAQALGVKPGQIAKSIIFYFSDTKQPLLIIVSGQNRVNKQKISQYLGAKIKTAAPEYVLHNTGYPVGGVPPVGHLKPIRTLIDCDLLQYPVIWAAAGTANSVFQINPQKLLQIAQAEQVEVT